MPTKQPPSTSRPKQPKSTSTKSKELPKQESMVPAGGHPNRLPVPIAVDGVEHQLRQPAMQAPAEVTRLPPPLTKNEIERIRIRHQTWAKLIDAGFGLGRTIARAGAWCVVAYFMYLGLAVSAGKETSLKVIVDAVVKFGADRWVAYTAAAIFGVGYVGERRLRRKTIAARADYIKQLESKIDPKRSTSRLTSTGQPQKEDEDGA